MGIKELSTFPTADIEYPIDSGELITAYEPYITHNYLLYIELTYWTPSANIQGNNIMAVKQ